MTNESVVALGHDDNVYVFNAIGVEGIIVNKENIITKINDYVLKDVKIFLISQEFSDITNEVKEKYKQTAYPIFITLAMNNEDASNGVAELTKHVEKATGVNLF